MTATTLPTPSAVGVFGAAIRAEWTKVRSVRSTVWTLLAGMGLAIGFGAIIAASKASSWEHLSAVERARFDPTSLSLSGLFIAQMAVGVLGAMLVTSEYATGQIRATLAATPQRLTVLAAKATTVVGVMLAVGLVASAGGFVSGQAIFAAKGIGASFGDPGVPRAVVGGALYLAAVGLLGLALGAIIRRTAGAISTFVSLLFILPLVVSFLPSAWNEGIAKYLPAQAGMAVFGVVPSPLSLSPWAGYAVLVGYAVLALAVGGLLLLRRDA